MECLFPLCAAVIHPPDQDKHIDVAHLNFCRAFEKVLDNILLSVEQIKHQMDDSHLL